MTSISITVNGAEYLELQAGASQAGVSLPAYVLTRCGVEMWRLDAARDRTPRPAAHRPVRLALERRCVTIRIGDQARAELEAGAAAAGLSIPQYIRTRCGFPVRWSSLPGTDERGNEEDDAWERLKRLGLNPQDYFED